MKAKIIHFVLQRFTLSLSIFLFLLVTTPGFSKDPSAQKTVRVAVKTNVPLTQDIVDELAQYGQVGRRMWKIAIVDMRVSETNLSVLATHPLVQYVEQDIEVFAIPIEEVVTETDFSGGFGTWDLDIINIMDSGPTTRSVAYDGEGVYVAVLDTGLVPNWRDYFPEERIDADHATAFTGGSSERSPWDDRGNAAVTERLWEKDTNSHGTHVTSSILGYHLFLPDLQIDGDINGVAPKATIIPVKVLRNDNSGFGSNLEIVAGLYYVGWLRESGTITAPIVVNMSLGTLRPAQSLEDAIDYAIGQGVIVVAAGGNEGDEGMGWPGAYPQVISAAAVGWKQAWIVPGDPNPNPFFIGQDVLEENSISNESFITFFSSRENDNLVPGFDQQLDLAAPGMWVFGPVLEHGAASPPPQSDSKQTQFGLLFGTSMASPHVAGTAALLLQKNRELGNPDLTQAEVEAILKETAIPIAVGTGSYIDPVLGIESVWGDCPDQGGVCAEEQGAGLLQVDKALDATP